MEKNFESTFELIGTKISGGGQKTDRTLTIIFEKPYKMEEEIALINLRREKCKVQIIPQTDNSAKHPVIEGQFELMNSREKTVRKIERLEIILSTTYDKETEVKAIMNRYDECLVKLVSVEQELDFEDEEQEDEAE